MGEVRRHATIRRTNRRMPGTCPAFSQGQRSGLAQTSQEHGMRACGGVPGTPLCRIDHPAQRRVSHNGATGLPRVLPRGLFFRPRWRPPLASSAWSTPSPLPLNDHAYGATLGRHGRSRRPEPKEPARSVRIRDRGSVSVRGSGRGSVRNRNRSRVRGSGHRARDRDRIRLRLRLRLRLRVRSHHGI